MAVTGFILGKQYLALYFKLITLNRVKNTKAVTGNKNGTTTHPQNGSNLMSSGSPHSKVGTGTTTRNICRKGHQNGQWSFMHNLIPKVYLNMVQK